MSADYGTEHFKGYGHPTGAETPGQVHVAWKDENESPLGAFRLEEIGELVQLAGQAWPAGKGVEVRYVIEMRRKDGERRPWTVMWSALAGDEQDIGVSEEYAQATLKGFDDSRRDREWRMSRRTIVTADEIITPQEGG